MNEQSVCVMVAPALWGINMNIYEISLSHF